MTTHISDADLTAAGTQLAEIADALHQLAERVDTARLPDTPVTRCLLRLIGEAMTYPLEEVVAAITAGKDVS